MCKGADGLAYISCRAAGTQHSSLSFACPALFFLLKGRSLPPLLLKHSNSLLGRSDKAGELNLSVSALFISSCVSANGTYLTLYENYAKFYKVPKNPVTSGLKIFVVFIPVYMRQSCTKSTKIR